MAESKEKKISLRRVLVDHTQPPKLLSHVIWTRVGQELQLDVGHVDLVELRGVVTAQQGSPEPSVHFMVTDRFVLSAQAALDLLNNVRDMVNDLRKEGILPPEGQERH